MADVSDLIVGSCLLILGAIITDIFINRYERKKDKIKIKEQLADIAIKFGRYSFEQFNLLYSIEINPNKSSFIDDLNLATQRASILADKLSALFGIYSKDNKDSKKMGTIIRKIANILNEINDKKISIKKRETYMEKGFEIHDELLNQIYDLIRDMQIDYRV